MTAGEYSPAVSIDWMVAGVAERSWLAVRAVVAGAGRERDWPRVHGLLAAYTTEVLRWRSIFNLTAARDEATVVGVHLVDGCAAAAAASSQPYASAADMGSGAGFVGVCAAVLVPEARVILIEARAKRAVFLERCIREMGLANATVIRGRLEELPGDEPELASGVDVCFARALANLGTTAEYGERLLREGGRLVLNVASPYGLEWPAGWEVEGATCVKASVGDRHVVVGRWRKRVEEEQTGRE